MASNPKIPNQSMKREPNRRGPTLVPKAEPPSSASPGVALAIVTAVLLLAAIFYFMPRAPKTAPGPANATTPAQPSGSQLSLSGLKMTPAPTGNAVSIDAQLSNQGSSEINGVLAEVDFPLANGQVAALNAPIQGLVLEKGAKAGDTGNPEDLTKSPIQPGQTRAVRIVVSQVPTGWNHAVPQIRVAETTGTTPSK